MRNDSFVLFDRDSTQMLSVSYGGAYRAKWSLEQHPGPKVMTLALRGQEEGVSPLRYLYPQHLELLYARFRQNNPGRVELIDEDDVIYPAMRELGIETVDRLTEERKMFVTLDYTDEELGYPYLRPFLPEIFEPEMIRRMEADPWLDVHLLGDAMRSGHVPHRRDYHERWSPEWRAYCDRLPAAGR